MSPLRDDEAFWLFDGGLANKRKKHPTRQSPMTFSVAERVDGDTDEVGLYISKCSVCGWVSPPRSQDLMRMLQDEHLRNPGGVA